MRVGGRLRFRGGHALAALAVVLIAALTVHPAAASKLTLASPSRSFATAVSRCSGNQLGITITGTAVAVTGLNATACAGAALRVFVHTASGVTSTSTTVSGSTANLTLGTAITAADGVTASLNGWLVPVTWTVVQATLPLLSCESQGNPSLTCTATVQRLTSWGNAPNRQWDLYVRVTTTSTTAVRWAVTVNLSSADLPFPAKGVQDVQGGLRLLEFSGCPSSPRTVRVQQTPNWANAKITAGSPADFELFGYETTAGNLVSCP